MNASLGECVSGVTFETKVYERDWRYLLLDGVLEETITRCGYSFEHRVLYINNVENLSKVSRVADRLVRRGVIDSYLVVAEHAQEALDHFSLTQESLGKGYYYSIAELVGILRCPSRFLLHFSSDALLARNAGPWIDQAIGLMDADPTYLVASPVWNHRHEAARAESHGELPEFLLAYGFSDQCYLVEASRFRQPIYHEYHPFSDRYPRYGGELFEKRVDSYMRNKGYQRLLAKNAVYLHRNYPRTPFGVAVFRAALRLSHIEDAHRLVKRLRLK